MTEMAGFFYVAAYLIDGWRRPPREQWPNSEFCKKGMSYVFGWDKNGQFRLKTHPTIAPRSGFELITSHTPWLQHVGLCVWPWPRRPRTEAVKTCGPSYAGSSLHEYPPIRRWGLSTTAGCCPCRRSPRPLRCPPGRASPCRRSAPPKNPRTRPAPRLDPTGRRRRKVRRRLSRKSTEPSAVWCAVGRTSLETPPCSATRIRPPVTASSAEPCYWAQRSLPCPANGFGPASASRLSPADSWHSRAPVGGSPSASL